MNTADKERQKFEQRVQDMPPEAALAKQSAESNDASKGKRTSSRGPTPKQLEAEHQRHVEYKKISIAVWILAGMGGLVVLGLFLYFILRLCTGESSELLSDFLLKVLPPMATAVLGWIFGAQHR
jgi:hypothetical protein